MIMPSRLPLSRIASSVDWTGMPLEHVWQRRPDMLSVFDGARLVPRGRLVTRPARRPGQSGPTKEGPPLDTEIGSAASCRPNLEQWLDCTPPIDTSVSAPA